MAKLKKRLHGQNCDGIPSGTLSAEGFPLHLDACAHDAVFHSTIVSTEGNSLKTIRRYRRLESNDVSPKTVAILNQQNAERNRSKIKIVKGG